jgi:hypothetical protein
LSKNFDYVGKKFIVKEKFKALCCGYFFTPGEILEVWKHPTSNRLYISRKNGSGHNVKRSTLNRCCEEINYD